MNIIELKKRYRDGSELAKLKNQLRPPLGRHKQTKLQGIARGCDTLLDDDVHRAHAQRLADRLERKFGWCTQLTAQTRLRFVTVLHAVTRVETGFIVGTVNDMWSKLDGVHKLVKGFHAVAAAEVEIVNIEVLCAIADLDDENEARKLNVIESMCGESFPPSPFWSPPDSVALVHFHAIVYLSLRSKEREERLGWALRDEWQGDYRVQIKRLFEKRPLVENLRSIANYMTKGGNEDLRYGARFGRSGILDDELDHVLKKRGHLAHGDPDDAIVTDSRALSMRELEVLVEVQDWLMSKKRLRDGYLVTLGQMRRHPQVLELSEIMHRQW
jgi:hypothetical protein